MTYAKNYFGFRHSATQAKRKGALTTTYLCQRASFFAVQPTSPRYVPPTPPQAVGVTLACNLYKETKVLKLLISVSDNKRTDGPFSTERTVRSLIITTAINSRLEHKVLAWHFSALSFDGACSPLAVDS